MYNLESYLYKKPVNRISMPPDNFESASYSRHANSWDSKANEQELLRYKTWFTSNTVDLWRHLDMFSVLNPFLKNYPKANWITIGDGNFGTAATYIGNYGGNAMAIDIADALLKIALEEKMISAYKQCNAEALPFENNSFDFSYCKQSYHHFPRPFIALYEMIRVSSKAIILSEPADWLPPPPVRRLLQRTKHILKRCLGRTIVHPDTGSYEVSGNYVFSISEREIEKIALGLNLPAVAFKRYQDIYFAGVENEAFDSNGPYLKAIYRERFKRKVKGLLGLIRPNNIQVIIFKEEPSEAVIAELKKQKYSYVRLARNPYI